MGILDSYKDLINAKPMHIATINNENNPNLSVASDVRVFEEDKIIVANEKELERYLNELINNYWFINESILMKPYYFKKLLNSTILEAPDINYEDLDYSEVYNRDLFKIEYIDSNIKNLQKDDVVLAKRDFTNYVYLNQEKYFLLNGKDYIEAKLEIGE